MNLIEKLRKKQWRRLHKSTVGILTLIILLPSSCLPWITPESTAKIDMDKRIVTVKNKQQIFIQPFNLFFQHYDFHVMLYFRGHPEYESVEAMIKIGEGPVVHAIITRHNQTQIHHINDEGIVERMRAERPLEVYYTPIQFSQGEKNGKPYVFLKFTSYKGENIVFDFYAVAKPSPKYGGLTDPGGHAGKTSLPIMYRERSTLAGSESSISIDGKKYRIPVKIWIPFFFKGMKGYYTEGFSIGVISTGEFDLRLVKSPVNLEPGKEWIYNLDGDKWIYKIIERNNERLTIQRIFECHGVSYNCENIHVETVDGSLEIERIELASGKGLFNIEFNPPLPDLIAMGEGKKSSRFNISIDEHIHLVTGIVDVEKEESNITLLTLNPEQPSWATKRAVQITIVKEDSRLSIKSIIKNWRGLYK